MSDVAGVNCGLTMSSVNASTKRRRHRASKNFESRTFVLVCRRFSPEHPDASVFSFWSDRHFAVPQRDEISLEAKG
jgi:hypothetical protein